MTCCGSSVFEDVGYSDRLIERREEKVEGGRRGGYDSVIALKKGG